MSDGKVIRFACPHCQKGIKVSAAVAGQRFACPNPACRQSIIIPAQEGSQISSTVLAPPVPKSVAEQKQAGFEVFVSHSSNDKAWADAVCAALEGQQIRCWMAPRDIVPGTEWGAAIIGGIDACKIMVLVFSAHANDSPQVRREVERAINKGLTVVPLRVEDVKPAGAMEYALSNTHWLDAFHVPIEKPIQNLVKAIQALRAGTLKPEPALRGPARTSSAKWLLVPAGLAGLAFVVLLCAGMGMFGYHLFSGPPKDDIKDNKEIAGGLNNTKTEESNKPAAETREFSEDFSKVKVGDQPANWKCDQAITVFRLKDDGPHFLRATMAGPHSCTVPGLQIRGDFLLEWDAEMHFNQPMELTLEGSDAAPSLPISLVADIYGQTHVQFPGGERRSLTIPAERPTKFRLEREGVIYRLMQGDKIAHARRLRDYKDFSALRIQFPGTQTKLYGIKVGPWTSSAKPGKSALPDADKAFRQGFQEDFKNAVVGGLPDGWEGSDSVSVRQDEGRPRLEAAQAAGKQEVRTPPLQIRGDFFVECECQLQFNQPLELKLKGSGGLSLVVALTGDIYGTTAVTFPGSDVVKKPLDMVNQSATIRIERDAGIYRVHVGDKLFHANRLPDHKDFDGIELLLKGGTPSPKVFRVRAGPR